jgi:hypothetical protein
MGGDVRLGGPGAGVLWAEQGGQVEPPPLPVPAPHPQGFDMQAQGVWFWAEGLINLFYWVDLFMNFFVAYEVGLRA